MTEHEVKSNRAWREECVSLRQQLAESDKSTLRLLETIKYLVGIAERGEGRKLFDEETAEQFVLDYVKRIEQQLAECQQKLEMAEAVIAGDGALITGLKDELAKCQARETSLRDDMKLASVQYMGCGGNLLPGEIVAAMTSILNRAMTLPSDSTALDAMLKQAKRDALLELESIRHFAWQHGEGNTVRLIDEKLGGTPSERLRNKAKELE
jgi:hypothetical protein